MNMLTLQTCALNDITCTYERTSHDKTLAIGNKPKVAKVSGPRVVLVNDSGDTVGSIINFQERVPTQINGTHRNKIPLSFLLNLTNVENRTLLANFNFSKITPLALEMFKMELAAMPTCETGIAKSK
jgi:hypothetical protein